METVNDQIYTNESLVPDDEETFDEFYRFFKKWSLGCGSLFGVPVSLHILNVVWLGLIFYIPGFFPHTHKEIYIYSIIFVLLSHELSHALVARHFGNLVKGIVIMLPLGAVAFIGLKEDKPLERLVVILAGPAANLLTALAIFLLPLIYPGIFYHFYWMTLLRAVFVISLIDGIFNLIPLYPMDGGQVVKDFLLVCKAGDRTAYIVTFSISAVSFAGLIFFSIKTANVFLFIIASIMFAVAICVFRTEMTACFQKIRQLLYAKSSMIKQQSRG